MRGHLCVPPGDYEVSIKFNEEHIPESPFVVTAAAPCDAARRLTVSSLQVRHREKPPPLTPPRLGSGRHAQGGQLESQRSPRGALGCL